MAKYYFLQTGRSDGASWNLKLCKIQVAPMELIISYFHLFHTGRSDGAIIRYSISLQTGRSDGANCIANLF